MKAAVVILLLSFFVLCHASGRRHHDDDDSDDKCDMIDCEEFDDDKVDKEYCEEKKRSNDSDPEIRRLCQALHLYEDCCEHRHKRVWKILCIVAIVVALLVTGIVTGCCVYHRKCKAKRTKTCPEMTGQPVIGVRIPPSASAPGKKTLSPWEEIDFTPSGTHAPSIVSPPPTYSTLPGTDLGRVDGSGDVGSGDPRELILSPPPPYSQKY